MGTDIKFDRLDPERTIESQLRPKGIEAFGSGLFHIFAWIVLILTVVGIVIGIFFSMTEDNVESSSYTGKRWEDLSPEAQDYYRELYKDNYLDDPSDSYRPYE